ncbi:SpoIIE family protein phosphatase [Candidatus Parabeggiatoa sp. HSG14]|uniref:SpoIIE family protein phosphatase n=1 Tax=Candidatus Parabeggiatoa sp. HSG14 TaxID=3055593 RepID=UPI0025A6FF82|nr:SpoIIE family protein phosphatase [Thiotrichales bacterium HSG14]
MTGKILIVDDEPNNLDVLNNCLRDAGFKVLTAEGGEVALKRVNHIKPDLILLDVMMQGIDGFETFRRLRKNEVTKDTPIIFITAKTDSVDKIKGLEIGAVDYITKPFQTDEVVTRVNKQLTIHHLQKELSRQNQELKQEITKRQQVEEKLRKFSRAVEQSANTIVITNLSGTIEFVNPAFTQKTGYSYTEAIGQNPRNILNSGKQDKAFYQGLWTTIQGGSIWKGEMYNKRKNGELYWEFVTISPIRNQLGQITHYVAIKEDITQRKYAEQEIARLNEKLKSENLRMSAELDVSRQLQQMLLPKNEELEAIDGLDIAGFMEPAAEVGGDYYDVIQHSGRVLLSIGDVTGHGLESGVLAIMVQSAIRALVANNETDPVKFLAALNEVVYHNVARMDVEKNLTLALLNYKNGKLRLSGQHEEVLIVRNGEVKLIDTIDLGFPIGFVDNIIDFIAEAKVSLNSGDVVVLYTDGITEAENPEREEYGINRLCKIVKQNWQQTASEIKQAVINDVRQYISTQKVFDDITLLVLKQK